MMNAKQRRFAEQYVILLNATQAAKAAGYSEATAYSQGSRLLKDDGIRSHIAGLQADQAQKYTATNERIIAELCRIAFLDLGCIFDPKTSALTLPSEMPEDVRRAIASIEFITVSHGEGEVEHVAKVRPADKTRALELLARINGMLKDNLLVTDGTELANRLRIGRQRAHERKQTRTEKK